MYLDLLLLPLVRIAYDFGPILVNLLFDQALTVIKRYFVSFKFFEKGAFAFIISFTFT